MGIAICTQCGPLHMDLRPLRLALTTCLFQAVIGMPPLDHSTNPSPVGPAPHRQLLQTSALSNTNHQQILLVAGSVASGIVCLGACSVVVAVATRAVFQLGKTVKHVPTDTPGPVPVSSSPLGEAPPLSPSILPPLSPVNIGDII